MPGSHTAARNCPSPRLLSAPDYHVLAVDPFSPPPPEGSSMIMVPLSRSHLKGAHVGSRANGGVSVADDVS